jgi:GntR family transcriptional repressor for pyruvate dehydrogenase complex
VANTATLSAKNTALPGAQPTFQAVRKTRRYQQVAEQIHQLIADGVLKPGDRLPPERELAAKFGVSRGSIRDALRTLEAMGIAQSHHGTGTIVRDLTVDSVAVPLSSLLLRKRHLVVELLDVRWMIEPALASRAAAHATDEEIARLEQILKRQREKMRRGEETIDEDSEFHYVIALAAGNSVVLKFLDVLMDLLRESRSRSLQVPGRSEHSYAGHLRIFKAIKRRDGSAAGSAARQHLREIKRIVMRQAR